MESYCLLKVSKDYVQIQEVYYIITQLKDYSHRLSQIVWYFA